MNGKTWRLRRIIDPADGKTLILPLDHGVTQGPIPGLVSPGAFLEGLCRVPPNAVVLHKGLLRFLPRTLEPKVGLIVHLSAATQLADPDFKILVTDPDEALSMGADGVSVHVNFGGPHERMMLRDLGRVAARCHTLGLPLLAMAYLRGGDAPDNPLEALAHAARVCAELGADLVKIPWPGTVDWLERIVEGCPVGIVIAGGENFLSPEEREHRVKAVLQAGAVGMAAGRTVFQAPDPYETLATLYRLIHGPDWPSLPEGDALTPNPVGEE